MSVLLAVLFDDILGLLRRWRQPNRRSIAPDPESSRGVAAEPRHDPDPLEAPAGQTVVIGTSTPPGDDAARVDPPEPARPRLHIAPSRPAATARHAGGPPETHRDPAHAEGDWLAEVGGDDDQDVPDWRVAARDRR
jgi:hypothetical protein